MDSFRKFLTRDFMTQQGRSLEPDGRLLHLYKCADQEFWHLVKLLRQSGPPNGYDFDQYRARWQAFREELKNRPRRDRFYTDQPTELDWLVRAFVLYAAEFWRRFMNDEWRQRSFPDGLPFHKLTWLHFLSLVEWTDLYHKEIAGYVRLRGPRGIQYRVAHTSKRFAEDFTESEWDEDAVEQRPDRPRVVGAGYPGLYFPMLAACDWWKVAPVRLPSSIRYLDTLAHQGGAADRLLVECTYAYETDSEVVYRPLYPPNGYGITALPIERKSLPPDADNGELHVTLVFGSDDGFSEV